MEDQSAVVILGSRDVNVLRDSIYMIGLDGTDPTTMQSMVEHAVRLWSFVLMERCVTASSLLLYSTVDGTATVLHLKIDSKEQREVDKRTLAVLQTKTSDEATAVVDEEPPASVVKKPALTRWQRLLQPLPADRSLWFMLGVIAALSALVIGAAIL